MNIGQLEHIIRAAAVITDDDELIIIGSQSILGAHPNAPGNLLVSTEAYVYPENHPERADLIDGTIGELSPFHETFGYYAQGVAPDTAVLADRWEERLIPIKTPATRGATGWCLHPVDLALAKLAAGREKDLLFVAEMVRAQMLPRAELERLAPALRAPPDLVKLVLGRIQGCFAR
jgi:hypothetical protein